MASLTASTVSPSMTISNTELTPAGTLVSGTCARSVGHSSSLVEAIKPL